MASAEEYLDMVLDSLSGLEGISYRPMMGEYIIYMNGKVVGGIYDNRLLLKPVKAVLELLEKPVFALPYEGAKNMVLIENPEDSDFLKRLIKAAYNDLKG